MNIQIFDRYGVIILLSAFAILILLESKFQLRKRVQDRLRRIWINFILALPAFALLRFVFIPVMIWLASENEAWKLGLNYWLDLPAFAAFPIAFLLLDYSNYLWHVLLHKLPFLWRFHLVHHTDLDLDITTAFRFHFGELIASVFFRGLWILLTGASPLLVIVYEICFEAATQFHHSNSRLPFRLEKWLNRLLVTPRMHGIHHSMLRRETDSNYSIIFPWWDRIHRTLKLNVRQDEVIIGVPSYANEKELTIGFLLGLPFGKIRKWEYGEERHVNEENELKP